MKIIENIQNKRANYIGHDNSNERLEKMLAKGWYVV